MIKIAYVNYWPRHKNEIQDHWFTNFITVNFGECMIVVPSNNPDILICSCFGDINIIKRLKVKCKIFFYGENLNRYPPYNNDKLLNDTFDLIVGFKKTDLSKKQIRFPLWLIYYKYYKYDKDDNILKHIQNKYNENIKKQKQMLASLVCRHDRGGQRMTINNKIEKYGTVGYGGSFKNNIGHLIGQQTKDKVEFISNSVYNICPENSEYEGYCTEKIFHALEAGTIALYWGVDLPEKNIIDKNKYCFCNIRKAEILEKQIEEVVKNRDKYIGGKIFNNDAGVYLQRFYDELVTGISGVLHD